MNKAFANHVTDTAFNLQLSRSMVQCLVLISVGKEILHRTFITSEDALRRRGLMERGTHPDYPDRADFSKPYLTDEGELVIELLKSAGLYNPVLAKFDLLDSKVSA